VNPLQQQHTSVESPRHLLTLEQVSAEPLGAASVPAEKRAERAPVPTAR